MKRGMVNSMRAMISTLSLEGFAIVVLGGLAAFRPVPSIGEWIFHLLLLWEGETAVGDGGDVVVCYVKLMGGLDSSGGKLMGGGCFLDEKKVE